MEKSHFNIRQVIELTGVSEYTLRAWEMRYRAFQPKRTDTGRRLYSKTDLEKARVLSELTQKGHKIGNIAPLKLEELKALLSQEKLSVHPHENFMPPGVEKIILSADEHDWDHCRELLLVFRKKLKPSHYIHQLILPLIRSMGVQVAAGNLNIAQEHILSALIKENLNALCVDKLPRENSARILFASPEGDLHEIGLLISLALARNSGLRTLYLGPNTPKKELCDTAIRFQATHVLISSTISKTEGAQEDFLKYLNFLDQHLPPKTTFWFGGRNIESLPFTLRRKHEVFKDFAQLEKNLKST